MYTGHRKKTKTHAKTQFNQKIVKTEKFPWGTSSFIYDDYYDDYDLEKSISKKYMLKYIKVYNLSSFEKLKTQEKFKTQSP